MQTGMKGYKLCPECGQPMLKKGQQRKHPDDYGIMAQSLVP